MIKVLLLIYFSLYLQAYNKGLIDTHGGNSDSLTNKKSSFSNNFSLKNTLKKKKIVIDKIEDIEKIKKLEKINTRKK